MGVVRRIQLPVPVAEIVVADVGVQIPVAHVHRGVDALEAHLEAFHMVDVRMGDQNGADIVPCVAVQAERGLRCLGRDAEIDHYALPAKIQEHAVAGGSAGDRKDLDHAGTSHSTEFIAAYYTRGSRA